MESAGLHPNISIQGSTDYRCPYCMMSIANSTTSHGGSYFLDQEDSAWREFSECRGKHFPFLVKLYVEPMTYSDLRKRQRLNSYALAQPFFCLVIESIVPHFALNVNGAADIHATSDGTLGGYMTSTISATFGVTCAHVAQNVSSSFTLSDIHGQKIFPAGNVLYTNFTNLANVGRHGTCNPYLSASTVNADLALLQINSKISTSNFVANIGKVAGVLDKTQLNSGDELQHMGANTGPNTYEIGGYGYMCKIIDSSSGNIYCFSDLFDFAIATSNRWQRLLSSLPVSGDSGSWLIRDNGIDKMMFGMVIAVDKARGIGIFGTSIKEYAKNHWQLDLDVL